MRISLVSSALLVSLLAACAGAGTAPSSPTSAAKTSTTAAETRAADPTTAPAAFDWNAVRVVYFRGLGGDAPALKEAAAICDAALARDPNDPVALVWKGAVDVAVSSHAYQTGDQVRGRAAWDLGMQEMDRATSSAPDRLEVRVPRGAVLFGVVPYLPDPALAKTLLKTAISDYELAFAREQAKFEEMPVHGRSELLFALADGYSRLGDAAAARVWYERLVQHAPQTELASYGRRYLAGERELGQRPSCTGCHGG